MTRRDLYRERLDLLQAALDHINQGFSVFDADLRLVAWNRQLFSMLEFPWHLARRGTHLSAFLEVNAARGEYGPGDVSGIVREGRSRPRCRTQSRSGAAERGITTTNRAGRVADSRGVPSSVGFASAVGAHQERIL